jgi:hypothetical protein
MAVAESFNMTFETLSVQVLKAVNKLEKELIRFPCMSVKHKLNLFDKLIIPILYYRSQILRSLDSHVLEHIHSKYCKKL